MADRKSDAAWARRFDTAIKAVLEAALGTTRRATAEGVSGDLAVWSVWPREGHLDEILDRELTVISRVRRPGPQRYLGEYTLRIDRPPSARDATIEFQRVLEGFGDYYLYCHANDAGAGLAAWTLIDLRQFRLIRPKGEKLPTHDGSAEFLVFGLTPEVVVDHNNPYWDRLVQRAAKEAEQQVREERQRAEAKHANDMMLLMQALADQDDDEVQA